MFIHGGFWMAFDGSHFSHMAKGLVGNGIPVAVPTYSLCPDVTLGAIIDEMRAPTAFLHRRFGLPVIATGHSAGGHLAAALLADRLAGLRPGASGARRARWLCHLGRLRPRAAAGHQRQRRAAPVAGGGPPVESDPRDATGRHPARRGRRRRRDRRASPPVPRDGATPGARGERPPATRKFPDATTST